MAEILEEKNQELENDYSISQQSLSSAEITNMKLNNDMFTLKSQCNNINNDNNRLSSELKDCREELRQALELIKNQDAIIASKNIHLEQSVDTIREENNKIDILRNELQITRLTCQDLVLTLANKENVLKALNIELNDLQTIHQSG